MGEKERVRRQFIRGDFNENRNGKEESSGGRWGGMRRGREKEVKVREDTVVAKNILFHCEEHFV